MNNRDWLKTTAIVIMFLFIGAIAIWPVEQATPSYHEKESATMVKKQKKFPWLPVLLGVGAGAALVVLLVGKAAGKNDQKHTLTVDLSLGASGTPSVTATFPDGYVVSYSYAAQSGSGSLEVRLDSKLVPASGSITMDADHALSVSFSASNSIHLAYSQGVLTANGIRYELVMIPSGQFQMGSDCAEAYPDEQPVHTVLISKPFWFGTTEVTQGLWQAVMGNNPSFFKLGDNHPVETIRMNDCLSFIDKLNQMLGGNFFRLPTEAEWEYACRAGSSGERYGDIDVIAWHGGNSNDRTHAVGQKQANAFGLFDMLGNVGEICQDFYGPYSSMTQIDPTGAVPNNVRTRRGAAHNSPSDCVRAARRGPYGPAYCCASLGFRLARTSD